MQSENVTERQCSFAAEKNISLETQHLKNQHLKNQQNNNNKNHIIQQQ